MMDLFVFDHEGGTLVWARMSGEWGRKECLHLLNLFQEVAFPPGSQVILDFARARHIDYRAVPLLMNLAARVERRRGLFRITGVSDYLRRIVELGAALGGREFLEEYAWNGSAPAGVSAGRERVSRLGGAAAGFAPRRVVPSFN